MDKKKDNIKDIPIEIIPVTKELTKKDKKKLITEETKKLHDKTIKANAFAKALDKKHRMRIATVFLYEFVGKAEIFVGAFPLLKGRIKELGNYHLININGKIAYIDTPNSDDFYISRDKKINKILHVTKFSDDDYRVKRVLDETYYKKEYIQAFDEELVDDVDDLGNKIQIPVKKLRFDKDGEPVYELMEVTYEKPQGITQEARDAIRAGSQYEDRMNKWKTSKETFLSKHADKIFFITALAIVGFVMIASLNSTWKNVNMNTRMIVDEVKEIREDPTLSERIADRITQKQDEANAPPS